MPERAPDGAPPSAEDPGRTGACLLTPTSPACQSPSVRAAAALAAPDIRAALERHVLAWYPREACGLLVEGRAGPELVPAANEADAWHERDPVAFPRGAAEGFALDPLLLVELERAGRRPFAVFHSHCDRPAELSDEDRRQARSPVDGAPLHPCLAHVVVQARQTGVAEIRVYDLCQEPRS